MEGRVLDDTGPDGIRHRHRAAPGGLDQAGHAELAVGPELQRVGEGGVDTPEHDVDRLELAERTQLHLAVAHDEISALDHRVAEVAAELGVFEGRFGEGPRRQDHDSGVVGAVGPQRLKAGPERAEERGDVVDPGVAVERREDARQHHAVLQGVAGAARRLGEVCEGPELAVAVATEIDGVGEQLRPVRQRLAVPGRHEARIVEDELRWDHATAEQLAFAVEIPQDEVEQGRSLANRLLDPGPLGRGHQQRDGVELPWLAATRIDDAIGRTVGVEEPGHVALARAQLACAHRLERRTDGRPRLSKPCAVVEQLVGGPLAGCVPGQQAVVGQDHAGRGSGSWRRKPPGDRRRRSGSDPTDPTEVERHRILAAVEEAEILGHEPSRGVAEGLEAGLSA